MWVFIGKYRGGKEKEVVVNIGAKVCLGIASRRKIGRAGYKVRGWDYNRGVIKG